MALCTMLRGRYNSNTMKIKYLICIILLSTPILMVGQPYFSKYYDPFDHATEKVKDLEVVGDQIYTANRGSCNDFGIECFKFAMMDLEGNLLDAYENDAFETGRDMEVEDGYYYVDGGNEPINDRVFLYRSNVDGSEDTLVTLLPPSEHYIYPFNRSMIKTQDHIILYGTARDTQDIQSSGEPKVKGITYWINKSDLSIDTIMILEPPYEFLRVEEATLDNEGNVLFIVHHDSIYPPNDFKGNFKSIYKYNSDQELIWEWTSRPNITTNSFSYIRVLSNGNIVFSIQDRDYSSAIYSIICLSPQGDKLWQSSIPIDGFTQHIIAKLEILNNGDIMAIGNVESPLYKYNISGSLTKFSPTGELRYHRVFLLDPDHDPGVPDDYASISGLNTLDELPNGDLIVGGEAWHQYDDPVNGQRHDIDMWVMRLDSMGCITANCDTHQIVRHQTVACATPEYRVVDPRNQWNVINGAGTSSNTSKHRFHPDSVLIDNKYYFQLQSAFSENSNDWDNTSQYFRECDGQVFFRTSTDENEFLYYDFTLEVGDTLYAGEYYGTWDLRVSNITEEEFLDGSMRKVWYIELIGTDLIELRLIEGIGATEFTLTNGIFDPMFGHGKYLVCFKNEGIDVLESSAGCWPPVNTQDELKATDIHIYPVPVTDILVVDTEIPLEEIKILNLNGQIIKSYPNQDRIDLSDLSSGIYLVKFLSHNGKGTIKKIVK